MTERGGQDPESSGRGNSSFLPNRGTRDKISVYRQRRQSMSTLHMGNYTPDVTSYPRLSHRKGLYCVAIFFEFESSLKRKQGLRK